jgi:hypothetical protein
LKGFNWNIPLDNFLQLIFDMAASKKQKLSAKTAANVSVLDSRSEETSAIELSGP